MSQSYSLLLKQLEALLSVETDPQANAANLSSFLYHNLDDVNWLGFYYQLGEELVLGPFHGQPACTRLTIGQGVCGTAFANQTTEVVKDVHAFAGHVACDAASESEIVVPFYTNQISGVLDVDSPVLNRFGAAEKEFFEAVVTIFVKSLKH
ncbi:GAF domain-containing protein [Marinicella sp. S1101]|uniref:GAF domain-containing protein n=1 Tax=Marinicella marina TaxID=2996016 RepID=UPI002260E00C|nr:GAF domain-containing protein [Marinicella marina]MCX7552433.1 GAF domain-containing protein [Marinicella marina]MDJ1139308.1 GAF domain-containing protein [Marinicella marina]